MTDCPQSRAVDRHFAGTISIARERALRSHLGGCEPCRRRYHRHLILEAALPRALGARRRLARGLGLAHRRRVLPALLLIATTCAFALVMRSGTTPEVTARGASLGDGVVGFRIRGATHAELQPADELAPADELSFAYRSSGEHGYLLVFAVDARGRVYWYYPAWIAPGAPPAAIAIRPAPELVELPEAIRHDVTADRLWIYAAFVDRPWTTAEVEARIGAGGGPILLDRPIAPRYALAVRR